MSRLNDEARKEVDKGKRREADIRGVLVQKLPTRGPKT
jgi:hypothetical protein